MNQKIETKKEGRQRKLTNVCKLMKSETTTYMVGCNFCKHCPLFVKEIVKEDGRYIHCDHIKAHQL